MLLAGFLVLPAASMAAPIHTLSAQLDLDAPARLNGQVSTLAGRDLGLQLALPADATPDALELVTGPHAEVILHRWVEVYLHAPVVVAPVPERDEVSAQTLTNVRVLLQRLDETAQVGLISHRGVPTAQVAATGADCLLDTDGAAEPLAFPRRGGTFDAPWGHLDVPGDAVEATCSAQRIAGTALESVFLYGMVVDVTSDQGVVRYETGPSEVSSSLGDPQDLESSGRQIGVSTIHHLLEIRRSLDVVSANVPLPGDLRLQSPVVAGAGTLEVPPSFGRLTWDIVAQSGRIEAFDAEGAFTFRAASPDRMQLDGTTTSRPRAAAQAVAAPASVGGRTATLLLAAGVGLLLLLAPLFSRLFDHDILGNQRRKEILDIVTHEPGVEVNTIARRLGYRWTNIAYHVRRLETTGHVVARRVGGRTALFLPLAVPREKTLATVLLRRETPRRITEILNATPGLDQDGLAQVLGLDQSQVSRTLKGLVEAGLVTAQREGRRTRYVPATAAATTPPAPVMAAGSP